MAYADLSVHGFKVKQVFIGLETQGLVRKYKIRLNWFQFKIFPFHVVLQSVVYLIVICSRSVK